jgi:hypothetical protein
LTAEQFVDDREKEDSGDDVCSQLRGRVATAGLWVPASAFASGLGFLVGGLAAVGLTGGFRSLAGLAIMGVVGGVLTGAFGGVVLGRLASAQPATR